MCAAGPWQKPPRILMGLTGLRIDGGIAVVTRCMARALDESIAEGRVEAVDRVLLLDPPQAAPPPPPRGEQSLSRGSATRFAWQLWRLYRRHRHDLVLFDLVGLARTIRLPLPGFPPRHYAIFVHGIELDRPPGQWMRALRGADRILVNSRFTAERVVQFDPSMQGRVHVVELCIDPERTSRWESLPKEASEPVRARAALIVGRMWPSERGKGHDQLLDAWVGVSREIPGAELWIIGGGEDRGRLEKKAMELGLQGAVRFLGRVSDDALRDAYERASIFAMPSRQEGFGLVYAEAMWHGLPCIGSTADAAGQVIVDGETGLLVSYGDVEALRKALINLFSDPNRTMKMGRAGAARAKTHFGYERFRKDFLGALDLG